MKELVRIYLEKYPQLRDNRDALIAEILRNEFKLADHDAHIVAAWFIKASLIDRNFRLIQEKNFNLQGKDWIKRQRVSQEVKQHYINLKKESNEIRN